LQYAKKNVAINSPISNILLVRISVVYLKQFFAGAPTAPNLIVETQLPQIK
jgi:hypothetical protein